MTTGLVGASTTEIVSGLQAGEVVVEPTVTCLGDHGLDQHSRLRRAAASAAAAAFPGGGGLGR